MATIPISDGHDVDARDGEADRVEAWRLHRALELGYNTDEAELLADSRHVDLHDIEHLLARGCPRELAGRILL